MFVIEVYKDNEFIGFANGNWDYDDNDDKYPYTIADMDFNRLPHYDYERAESDKAYLEDMFPMYEFIIKELD